MSRQKASETDVMQALRGVSITDSGRNEVQKSDGLYERIWWDIEPDATDGLSQLDKYSNVSLVVREEPDTGYGSIRVVLEQCLQPVRPDEHERHVRDRNPHDVEDTYRF